jgi:hypothetical protein
VRDPLRRPPDERAAISAGKLSSPHSVGLRARNATALRLAIKAGGMTLVQPRVRPRAIHRLLHQLAPTLNPGTKEGEAVLGVLARTHRAFGLFCQRNPGWMSEQIAAAEKDNAPD